MYFVRPDRLEIPTLETYRVECDSAGFIWLGTRNGAFKWDGEDLHQYYLPGKNRDEWMLDTKASKQGGMWVLGGLNRVYYYNPAIGRFEKPLFHDTLRALAGPEKLNLFSLDELPDGRLCAHGRQVTFQMDPTTGRVEQLHPEQDAPGAFYYIRVLDDKTVLETGNPAFKGKRLEKVMEEGVVKIDITWAGKRFVISAPLENGQLPVSRCEAAVTSNGKLIVQMSMTVFVVSSDGSWWSFPLPNITACFLVDSKDNIWLGMRHRGLYFYDHESGYKKRIISLNEMTVMGVCEDHEGNIWATTQDNGVFICRNPHILHYPEIPDLNKILYSTYSSPHELMFASHKGRLVRIRGLRAETVEIEDLGYIPLAMEKTGSHYGITTSSGVFLCDTNFTHLREVKTPDGFTSNGGRFISYAGEDSLVQGNRSVLSLIHKGVSHNIFEPEEQISQLATMADSSVVVIFLAKDSLFIIHRNLEMEWRPCPKGTLQVKNPTKELFFCLTRDALLLHAPQGEIDILRGLGIHARQVNDVVYDAESGLWLATSDGLVHVFHDLRHETFARSDGLPHDKVLEVQKMGNHLFLLTESGLFVMPTSIRKSQKFPMVRTASVLVDEGTRHLRSDSLLLDPEEHQVVFQFDILSFKATPNPLVIEYKVQEFGPEWISANSRKMTLSNLSSRTYHLQVRVAGHDGYLPGKVLRFVIVARPPFWRTSWFMGLLVLAGLGLVALVVRANGQRIRRKEAEKTRINKLIAESQMSALQAHMNPHFIFNVINSIQSYVLESDSQTAYDQLTKFSRVVRSVLEQARRRTIPLSDELALLTSYVELEQLRFSDVFDFKIELAPEIAVAQLHTPPLLLQPFVENAILHGLAPLGKGAGGILKVQVMRAGEMLRISISDNGIGRAKAAKVAQRPDHRSLGTTIMEERINALRLLPGYQTATIKVSDLHPGAENCGTLVEIFLPEKMENMTN